MSGASEKPKPHHRKMADAEDLASYEGDNRTGDESTNADKSINNSPVDATVSKSSSNAEVVSVPSIPVHVTFYENVIGESSNSLAPVPMDTETFCSTYRSNNPLSINLENAEEYHQVIELKEDDGRDSRPARGHLLYSCHFRHCGFQSPDREGLTEHVVSFHNNVDRETRDSKSAALVGGGLLTTSKPKEFQCDLCQMKFTNGANMQRHRMSHLGVRPFECRICSKKFTRNDHLMEHLVRQHSKQRPYKCPFCIKSYSMKPSLKSHLASDHSGIPKDKVCRICGFRATTVAGAKIHYTNTHLRNGGASTPASGKINNPHGDEEGTEENDGGTETPADLMEEMDLARVSQNFSFNNQDVSVPTSTAPSSFPNDNPSHNTNGEPTTNPTHQSSFRRYQATTSSFLPLPLCSSSLTGSIIEHPSFPGTSTSTLTDVTSSMREKTAAIFPASNEGPFLCTATTTSSTISTSNNDLKQEPIDIDDGHNSCSSSAGAQPTSTMDATENCPQRRLSANAPDEDDAEVGNHFAAQLRNKTNPTASNPSQITRNNANSSEEDDTSNQNEDSESSRVERKPEINSLIARSSKYERRRVLDRKPCHRGHCCEAGDAKVSTSVRNLSGGSNNSGRDVPEAKPVLGSACLHRKVSTASTVSNERRNSLVLSREATEPAPIECAFCGIIFPDRTLYYLHRGMHSDNNPWKCNMCGEVCDGKYDFYAHVISREHR